MTRQEKAERRELIKRLYSDGVTADVLAERFGINKKYIYQFAGKGRGLSGASIKVLRTNSDEVKRLLETGMSYAEVGRNFGTSKDVVREFCKENNICRGSNKNGEKDVAKKIRDKSDGLLEYVSGYTIKENPVRVRCNVCGGEFERTYHNITTKGRVTCPLCIEAKRAERKAREQNERDKRKRLSEINKAKNAKQLRLVVCPVCGETFLTWNIRHRFCSDQCRKESARLYASYNQGSDDRLNQSNVVDKDIDLNRLYERDKGVCQICGKPVDFNDCHYNDNGAFVAGNLYPSKDHIVPLSLGGKHSWDNVRLAHRICNVKIYAEQKNA